MKIFYDSNKMVNIKYMTLTTPVNLNKFLEAIKIHVFVASEYPFILTLEDHLTPDFWFLCKVIHAVYMVFAVDRYGVRTKAGKKQSSEDEDAGVKIAHSAGASIRRHNELALNKWDR
ncbi:putative phosphoinositide phospholipase C [Helianthus annuus]|uniref:Phosphoinositide phospholipase C n=1 Tax=Helianthus annuus TaxID=4232 RepID=A0A9K3DRH5_HELAN|nr:putative phosphoinositide phospholipase C [Helianthus annuus]KAJ0835201.1 putative phosphoinositide phospholipase C [Helianthus annuus]